MRFTFMKMRVFPRFDYGPKKEIEFVSKKGKKRTHVFSCLL